MTQHKPLMLFSWRDVRDRMSSEDKTAPWHQWDADLFGLRVYTDQPEDVIEALIDRLGPAFDPENLRVDLISTHDHPRHLPVELLPASDADPRPPRVERPLWASSRIEAHPTVSDDNAAIGAFFSFKGGVGRTTTCFATLVQLLDRQYPARVLYIDADVEAPGLTWMVGPEERLSWVDALALVHDSDDWQRDALPLIAERVGVSQVGLELSAGRREFYFMPAVRWMAQIERIPVTPEQAIRRHGRSWVIGDLMIALAKALALDAVLVDLRAGITEFASPLMLDPRTRNILITSCAEQSVRGTLRAMQQVEARTSWPAELDVIVSQVPRTGDDLFADINRRIDNAWADEASDEGVPPTVHRVGFTEELLVFDDLQRVADRLAGTSLSEVATALADRLVSVSGPRHDAPESGAQATNHRLAELAKRFEFAENNATLGLLPIPPLRNLVRVAPDHLPAAVVLGSKGAGKTFTWAQMVVAGRWQDFSEAVGERADVSGDVRVFPLLAPVHLGDDLRERVKDAEHRVRAPGAGSIEISDLLHTLQHINQCDDGLAFWLKAIASRLGLDATAAQSLRAIDQALRARNQRIVLVIDGIEDALQVGPARPMNTAQQVVLRGLMVDLVNQLRDLGTRQLGIVVFIRRDLARSAILQNFGQFEARHEAVALSWSPADALRLIHWLLAQTGWTLLDPQIVVTSPYETLAEKLHPFWGEKLGGQREAYTDRWVIGALSDLNGRFQARDLVRLVQSASRISGQLPLPPSALRSAVEECSAKKVEELAQEVEQLAPVFETLKNLDEASRTIPVSRDKLALEDDAIEFLEDQGILFFDPKEELYYMPEIIRHGLGFTLLRRGRARVISLQRAAARRPR